MLFTERFLSVFFDSRANISRHLQNVQRCFNRKMSRTNEVRNALRKRFEMPFFAAFFESLLLDKVTVIAHLIDTLLDVGGNRQAALGCKLQPFLHRRFIIKNRRKEKRRNVLLIAGIYRTTIIVLVPQGAATAKALIKIQNCQTRRAVAPRSEPADNICSHPAQSQKQYPQTRFGQCCCIWLQRRMAEPQIHREAWILW